MKNFDQILNLIAALILGIAVIGMLITSFINLSKTSPEIATIKIEYHGVKTDSINALNKIEIKKIDSILTAIKETSNQIQEKQLLLIKEKENDSFFDKLFTTIIAIIVGIAGFFGFKSMSEIKTKAIEDAKEESKKIAATESKRIATEESIKVAKEEFIRTFNEDYEAKVFQKATESMTNFLRTEIKRLEEKVFELEESLQNEDLEDLEDLPHDEISGDEENLENNNPFENDQI